QQDRPTLMLLVSDQAAILQLGTRWEVEEKLLEDFTKHLAQHYQLDCTAIQLSPLPVTIDSVHLTLNDGQGNFITLQKSTSSHYPPYSALFNLTLTAAQKSQVISALNGREDILKVSYRGNASVIVIAESIIEGDIQADLVALGHNPSIAECEAQLEQALHEERLTLRQTEFAITVPSALQEKVDQLAKEKAVKAMQDMAQEFKPIGKKNESLLKVTASTVETVLFPLEASSDISHWFANRSASDHMQIIGVSIAEPDLSAGKPLSVKLGFDAKSAPVAFVQVVCGQTTALLRPPAFQSITIPASDFGKPLMVKTNYTTGGSYEITLTSPEADAWVLAPKELGLVQVTLDATARRKAGATAAQFRVHYQPTGAGNEDEQVINFRYGEWAESWFVITRSDDLQGDLDVEWKETAMDGSVIKYPLFKTDNPKIVV
ncbi:MAG: hypothetical protein LUQ18_00410, partial [Methylococcaceae bacterium]|nr:hypothetical protein [Methylococcaceae bacterium]